MTRKGERTTLEHWLQHLTDLHPSEIEFGLERVREVWHRLRPLGVVCPVIILGGTNGKGSCVAMFESILSCAGYRVGTHTSPHLMDFNERIRINGHNASDQQIVAAFEQVEEARQADQRHNEVSLTYFEFALLAALEIFLSSEVDVMVLEVGLGGRLDAVNIIDADVAIVTTVDLDHTAWLGTTRDKIGFEKAGIYRSGRPAVFGSSNPPATLLDYAKRQDVSLQVLGRDYFIEEASDGWSLRYLGQSTAQPDTLPNPGLVGKHQRENAAAVLVALHALSDRLSVTAQAIHQGLGQVSLEGRFQTFAGQPSWLLDVAHNHQAACSLADNLSELGYSGKAVFSMLADKPVEQVVDVLSEYVNHWYLAPLNCARTLSAETLSQAILAVTPNARVSLFDDLEDALLAANKEAGRDETILVTGSFYTVGGALHWLKEEGNQIFSKRL